MAKKATDRERLVERLNAIPRVAEARSRGFATMYCPRCGAAYVDYRTPDSVPYHVGCHGSLNRFATAAEMFARAVPLSDAPVAELTRIVEELEG